MKCDVIATLTRITRKRIIMTLDVTDESSIDHNLDEVLWKLLHKIGLKGTVIKLLESRSFFISKFQIRV